MKNPLFLLLSLAFLFSCAGNGERKNEKGPIPITKKSTDSTQVIVDTKPNLETELKNESGNGSFTLKAKFLSFRLGDAEHYEFEDESGKYWDFAGSKNKTFYFSQELNENEADESNQGWGSNKELQGKWFLLTVIKVEQPEYIDGPMVMANIIQEAVLVEE